MTDHILAEKRAVLGAQAPLITQLTQRHLANRRLWFPGDIIPASEVMSDKQAQLLAELPDAAKELPDAARISVALNLLTEEGLPHFHRLIASHLGEDNGYADWNNLWTAEEDRHGNLLRDYIHAARLFDSAALDKMQYEYIAAGFNPDWEKDPYRLLAYTSLQERATQRSHANTGQLCGRHEPLLQKVFGRLAADEKNHYEFYRDLFAGILADDPNQALLSLYKVMPLLQMPGHTVPGYDDMAQIVYKADIYGPHQYRDIVEELLKYWGIGRLTGLSAEAEKTRDKLMSLPQRLQRLARRMDRNSKPATYQFAILYHRDITY